MFLIFYLRTFQNFHSNLWTHLDAYIKYQLESFWTFWEKSLNNKHSISSTSSSLIRSTFTLSLYPRHLCRGVYSFRLSVRPFVRSFVLPSVAWNLRQSFALKFLKWCISQQLLIRKHSYLDHSYPGGLAFTP